MTHVPVLDWEMVPCSAQESESASGGPQLPTSGTTPVRERRKPTPATLPEMPAVHSSSPEILEAPATSAHPPLIRSPFPPAPRPSWGDAVAHDPITESGGRTTEISIVPMAVQKRDRALLLRMDGVHAGEVIPLNAPKITIGRHPNNLVVTDDTGVSRFHAEILVSPESVELFDKAARNGTLVQGKKVQGSVKLRDGDFIQLGPRVGFRFSFTDAKQERLLKRLYESSNRDALTGAYNRKHFDERLLAESAYAARNHSNMALLLFDLDHFKKVNDTYGHAAGDAVLRHVAGVTMGRLRTEDVFARIGGEEFAVLLRGVTVEGSARLAERLRTSISSSPVMYEGRPIPVTISVGCAGLHNATDMGDPSHLLRLADDRLYTAKNSGRNRVVSS